MTHQRLTRRRFLHVGAAAWVTLLSGHAFAVDVPETKFSITIDRGADVGQSFGSLFEAASEDGSLAIGAGFQNCDNTRNRADHHALQFFIRPVDGQREFVVHLLPRPNNLCGT